MFSNNNGNIQCHVRRKSIVAIIKRMDVIVMMICLSKSKSCWLNRYLTLPQDPDLKGIENVGIDF